MYGPPSVSFPVGRSRWHGLVVAMLVCVASITSASLYFAAENHSVSSLAANFLVTLGLSGLAIVQWLRSPQGQLRWDGESWWWSDMPVLGLRCTVDAQKVMLLKLELEGRRPVWLCLERAQGTITTWRAVRRALVFFSRLKLRPTEVLSEALP